MQAQRQLLLVAVACLTFSAAALSAEAPYQIAWKRQLGTASTDVSDSVAVDADGNAFISGETEGSLGGPNAGGGDVFLAKYDSAGNLLWTDQLGTSGNGGSSLGTRKQFLLQGEE